jgi:hypothetical protein
MQKVEYIGAKIIGWQAMEYPPAHYSVVPG